MQVKSFIATVGISAAAGAAAILMLPKNSAVYQKADDTVQMIKQEAGKLMNSTMK